MIDQNKVLAIKEFLLEHNPSKIENESVFEGYIGGFFDLFETFEHQTEGITDSFRLLIVDTFSIWILRSTQCLRSKKVDTAEFLSQLQNMLLTKKNSEIIFQYLTDFWTDGTTAFNNALREMFTKLLRLLDIVYSEQDRSILFNSWLEQILNIRSTLKVQYHLIDSLAPATDLYSVLQKRPDFIETSLSLMWSDALSNPIGKCLTSLLLNIYRIHYNQNESMLDQWLNLWQNPVLRIMDDLRYTKAIELYILTPLFREMPKKTFVKFIERCSTCKVSVSILLLRIGQELVIEEEPYHHDKLISLETVEQLLQQDNNKLHAFELLTFSSKTSKPVHPYIFEVIKRNLRIFFVDTNIETRNYFCSSFKHFVLRIRDSAYALNRDREKLIKAKKFPEEQDDKLKQIMQSEDFLRWLFSFLKTQICPGTQYQRNTLAFKILVLLLESGIDDTISEKYLDSRNLRTYPFSIQFFEDGILIRSLIDNLTSNYNDIRRFAKILLTMAFHSENCNSLRNEFDWKNLHQRAEGYMEDYQNTEIGAALQDFLFLTSSDKKAFMDRLLGRLQEKINESKKDYLKYHHDPVGGYFATLALLLKNDEFTSESYYNIITRCLSLILNNWDAVKGPVCCDPTEAKTALEYSKDGIKDQYIAAKAFRSIKESSALLEVIIARPSTTFEQLKTAGDFLICQLSNLRHSGAFQSVLPSFNACCSKCSAQYPNQLEVWLHIVIESLEVKTQMVTRRSGGIPYLLTAILASEKGRERPLLKFAFENLERIASLRVTQYKDEVDLPQVNAFNCIRSIFIASKLAEPCAAYVASALNLSLKNFTSNIWSLRNCSIMLFTSLQNRIFGKAGKSVSARLFFTRYYGVKELLLNVLKASLKEPTDSSNTTMSQSHVESIFLVLNLLLRLQPTPGYSGLEVYYKKVYECLESCHWHIREMAAKTMASLNGYSGTECIIMMEGVSTKNQNKLHGHLLVVKNILERNKELVQSKNSMIELFDLLLARCEEFLILNTCFATAKAYIEVLEFVLNSEHFEISKAVRNSMLTNLSQFFISHNEKYTVDGMKQLCLAMTLRMLFKHEYAENIPYLCRLSIISEFQRVQSTAIQYIVEEIDLTAPTNRETLIELKRSFMDPNTATSLKPLILRALRKIGDEITFDTVAELIREPNNEELQLSAIETLGCLAKARDAKFIEPLIGKYSNDDMPTDFRMASLKCSTNFSKNYKLPSILLQVHKMLNDDDDEIRKQAAEFLNKFFFRNIYVLSPSVTAAKFGQVFCREFSTIDDAREDVVRKLTLFWSSYDIFAPASTGFDGLFEVEKDNQFRNDIEQNIQYINILKRWHFESIEFSCWVRYCVERLLTFLKDSETLDGPLGWSSHADVFPRLCIMWNLAQTYATSLVDELEKSLRTRNVHPLIFDYLFIDF
ncbi:uncharacterized protein ZBAI_00290 [Zygosaccharomyces bailii ISA1307]|nr:uncharacterized protein ZBAI_00290 [Zygosaccharomyces bailii ISA1307]